MAFAALLLISTPAWATDCFDMAGRDYRIDPDLLRAISWQESNWVVDAIGKNPGTGYGAGLMQIDSQHHAQLAEFGIKPEHLLTDTCLNIYTGAYYLALAFKKWGVSWEAVGAYNAGFRRSDRQNMRRLAYARRLRLSTGPSRQIKMPDNPGLLKTKDLMNEVFFQMSD
jgi:soluble lytic murein transglycosylase-like protein